MKSCSSIWVRVGHSVLGTAGPFEYEFVWVRVGLGSTSLDSFRFSATSYVTFYRGAVATCNDHGFKQNKEQFSEKCRNWRGCQVGKLLGEADLCDPFHEKVWMTHLSPPHQGGFHNSSAP